MSRPEQLLLSDLLSRRVRDAEGVDQGTGVLGWMHPPVHRLLGWASRPSALAQRRCIWRLDQLQGLSDSEVLVRGTPADTEAATLERLPTLFGAVLFSASGEPLGRLVDAAVDLRSGRIRHYLVARSDPRLPGGSRWRLSPERLLDQRPGEVFTALEGLEDLPLAQASLRESLRLRSRRWREQWGEETSRLREQWQQASGRLEERLEGWLEEPPWAEEPERSVGRSAAADPIWPEDEPDNDEKARPQPPRRRSEGREPLRARRPEASAEPRFRPEVADPEPEGWDPIAADSDRAWSEKPQEWQEPADPRGRGRRRADPSAEPDDPWV